MVHVMRKIHYCILAALLIAITLTLVWPAQQFDEQLIRLQAKNQLSDHFDNIEQEPINLQAILLDYSDEPTLLLQAQLAILKYPEKSRSILELFGSESVFQDIFQQYGDVVIPVIHWFYTEDILPTIKLRNSTGKLIGTIKDWWQKNPSNPSSTNTEQPLTPEQQAWYAVLFIQNSGYDFIGQFSMNPENKLQWIQSERVTEGLTAFFARGLRDLETRYKTDQKITAETLLWASVDVLAIGGTFKLLRAGKHAARTGKSLPVTRQASLYASRLVKNGFAGRVFKYSAVLGTGWLIIQHPSLLTSFFAEVGNLIGLPPFLTQFIGIALLAFLLLYPFTWFIKWVIKPILMFTKWLLISLIRIETIIFKKSQQPSSPHSY